MRNSMRNSMRKSRKNKIYLSDDEIEELIDMYLSGLYYVKEICEWFGINYYDFKLYLRMRGL